MKKPVNFVFSSIFYSDAAAGVLVLTRILNFGTHVFFEDLDPRKLTGNFF